VGRVDPTKIKEGETHSEQAEQLFETETDTSS